MSKQINKGQLARLQTLYGKLAGHTDQGADRVSRLAWASDLLQRPVTSFSDLTSADATHLIDSLQGQLGIAPTRPAARPRLGRDEGRKAGTEGRRNNHSNELTFATEADLARIQRVLSVLGWSKVQFDGWLRSPRSPLSNKSNPAILTLWDANRVYWALKGMATKQGKWKK